MHRSPYAVEHSHEYADTSASLARALIAAHRLECRRTRWSATAELRLRYATVDLSQAVFEYPLTIAAEPGPFVLTEGQPLAEDALAGTPDATVRMASVRGVDAAHLVLADIDLSRCLFTGTVHLDQLRLEGTCTFDTVPSTTAWRHGHPVRFTRRSTLAEEHHWRASQPAAVPGWNTAVLNAGQVGPAQLAPVYRALRKSYEDSKNEPGAADFYYGEMEMRRHNQSGTTRAERGLLHGYWLLSGYGLRASRALGWLAAAMLTTVLLLMGFGLPQDDPKQEATGTVPPGGGQVTFEIKKDDPPESHHGQVQRAAVRQGAERHPELGGLPLLGPGPHHLRHLHRDGLPRHRTHPPRPGRPRRPRPRQTLTHRTTSARPGQTITRSRRADPRRGGAGPGGTDCSPGPCPPDPVVAQARSRPGGLR